MTDPRRRPGRLVAVVGTGTEVGKTWVAARLVGAWRRRGLVVAARKPAQSQEPGTGPSDAEILGAASGEDPATVCPRHRWYDAPLAPPMAAEMLGRPTFSIEDLARELDWGEPLPALGLLETAGGVRSPLADDGDTLALLERLAPDAVVLVAGAGLGALNAVRLSVDALGAPDHRGPRAMSRAAPVVVLNRFDADDALHRANRDWLAGRDGLRVAAGEAELDALADALAAGSAPRGAPPGPARP